MIEFWDGNQNNLDMNSQKLNLPVVHVILMKCVYCIIFYRFLLKKPTSDELFKPKPKAQTCLT